VERLGDLVPQELQPAGRPPAPLGRHPQGPLHELDTGHYPMLSEPAALAKLIVEG